MTLTQLRSFMAVADTGSVRAAAERLVVTQSAVSAALAALQDSLGVRLVAPQGRGLRLTSSGETFAAHARRALALLEEARVAAVGETDPLHGEVRIAAITTAGEQVVPALLASFRYCFPQAGMSLEVGNRERVWTLLEQHEVDVVVGGRPQRGSGLVTRGMRPNALVVVAPRNHAPEEGPQLVSWLAGQQWLLREHGSGTRATTEAYLERHQLTPRILTVGSNVAVRECVAAGLGVTLISRDAVKREIEEGVVEELPAPDTPIRRDWHLVTHTDPLPATAALFVDHLLTSSAFEPSSAAS